MGKDPGTVLIQPDNDLDPHTRYQVRIQGLALDNGTADDQTVTFTTRALQRGPRDLVTASPDFELNRAFPSGGEQEPVMDFSTFRFQFSQPIDPATVSYGHDGSVRLVDAEGDLVAARLLVDGPYMTLDPRDEYLTPGARYTSTWNRSWRAATAKASQARISASSPRTPPERRAGVHGATHHRARRPGRRRWRVQPHRPAHQPGTGELHFAGPGQRYPVQRQCQRGAGQHRELPGRDPFRIARGTLLTGSNIDVMIGGAVPAGISSGQVNMHFLSDATGYMVPNPTAPPTTPHALSSCSWTWPSTPRTRKPTAASPRISCISS
ncbi:hypothetical protein HML84_07625 [Alcanivorax sp. IO_7]|nr:hypothetical protein HML84_07625 [Alcanivorax sp. IO_7]